MARRRRGNGGRVLPGTPAGGAEQQWLRAGPFLVQAVLLLPPAIVWQGRVATGCVEYSGIAEGQHVGRASRVPGCTERCHFDARTTRADVCCCEFSTPID